MIFSDLRCNVFLSTTLAAHLSFLLIIGKYGERIMGRIKTIIIFWLLLRSSRVFSSLPSRFSFAVVFCPLCVAMKIIMIQQQEWNQRTYSTASNAHCTKAKLLSYASSNITRNNVGLEILYLWTFSHFLNFHEFLQLILSLY